MTISSCKNCSKIKINHLTSKVSSLNTMIEELKEIIIKNKYDVNYAIKKAEYFREEFKRIENDLNLKLQRTESGIVTHHYRLLHLEDKNGISKFPDGKVN